MYYHCINYNSFLFLRSCFLFTYIAQLVCYGACVLVSGSFTVLSWQAKMLYVQLCAHVFLPCFLLCSQDDITMDSLTFLVMVTNDECDLSDVIVNYVLEYVCSKCNSACFIWISQQCLMYVLNIVQDIMQSATKYHQRSKNKIYKSPLQGEY